MPGDAESKDSPQFLGRNEAWNYAPAMQKIAAKFRGTQGVVLHLGDSITFADPYTAWARNGRGKTPEDEAVLRWSHCGEENDGDGWRLAHVETGQGGSYTAAGGVRADQYLAGGFKGLLSLDGIIAKYNPQVATLMLGTNDAWQARPVADYRRDMDAIVTKLLDNGTVVILSTIPPLIDNLKLAEQYNDALWRIAEQHGVPVIDFYGEILARRRGMSWDGTLMEKGDGHPSGEKNGVTAESAPTPANLRESGYLLRGWLSVKKLEEVKSRVLEQAPRPASWNSAENRRERAVIENTFFPRTGMCWSPLRGDRSAASMAKHDLIMTSVTAFGLEWDKQPEVLATGFKPQPIEEAKKRTAELRKLNPNAVLIGDLSFYEWDENQLPADHPWWLKVDGKRKQFWPGTYRMDWYRKDYQESVIRRTIALYETGVVDGVFYDNLRADEPEPWINITRSIREVVGDKFLIFVNAGYDIGTFDWLSPYLNGIMYESGWSHAERREWKPNETWDDRIRMMQRTESLLLEPRISLIERFEEVRDHAGWPNDPLKGKEIKRDPPARHWTMAYALIIGDFCYLFSDSTSHRHDWYPEYDIKIGLPVAPGERINAHVWQRRYDKALVIMNLPDATQPYEVKLDRSARDSFTGETGTRFVVPPGDGRILVNE
jgi:lysophospholipase L1-like esterase